MNKSWYYFDGEKAVGPLSQDALRQLRLGGILASNTLITPEGTDDWKEIDTVLGTTGPPAGKASAKPGASSAIARLTAGVGAIAGLESRPESGGFRELFRDTFKKRTIEEMDSHFAVGSPEAIPPLQKIDTSWPAPWVFLRLITFSIVGTLGFYWLLLRMKDSIVLPGWIFLGAFGIPFSVLMFFLETNVARNVSFYRVLKLFMLGGLLSLIATAILNEMTDLGSWMGASSAGPIEEAAKVLAVIAFAARWKDKRWSLNGLLFGASVGAGFAAFETAGYILGRSSQYGMTFESMMFNRALWSPFCHVIWTAAAAAAFWKVMADRDFSVGQLADWRFLRVLLLVAGIHAVWNSPFSFPFVGPEWGGVLKRLSLGLIGWTLILLLIQDGLSQIRLAQEAEPAIPEPGPPVPASGVQSATAADAATSEGGLLTPSAPVETSTPSTP
ncbi:MAG: PrsW family intramembrane metalloprotease [Verrucomicrobiae bacterium]|nr:PrsW family intramembrane metalloprotease [Verrucomicrobiae bacterium]